MLDWEFIGKIVANFCFGYPFVIAWYWMTGSLLYYFIREMHEPMPESPPELPYYPFVSLLLPCYNESAQLEETLAVLMESDYPNFEVIAINDGSKDNTGELLINFAKIYPRLRVVNLTSNQGKSTALNAGTLIARGEFLVCIDGDALLDKHAITWFIRRFQSDGSLGALTGNPRIRNRSTLLGRLQVGEFSSIVGMIKRTQTVFGSLFTVSGVICAFRKLAVLEAGLWDPNAMTDDVDLTLRIQIAGWNVVFEPNAICWILMPETLKGLWRQRLRWAEGGSQASLGISRDLFTRKVWRLLPLWFNFFLSTSWACLTLIFLITWAVIDLASLNFDHGLGLLPLWWGTILTITYLMQSLIGLFLDSRYEKSVIKTFYWLVWYPLVYWLLQSITAVVGFYKAVRRPATAKGKWISPDRGLK